MEQIDHARPLACLLRVTDCLQDWERPSATNATGVPDSEFAIDIVSGRVEFTVLDPGRRGKIATDMSAALVVNEIDIV